MTASGELDEVAPKGRKAVRVTWRFSPILGNRSYLFDSGRDDYERPWSGEWPVAKCRHVDRREFARWVRHAELYGAEEVYEIALEDGWSAEALAKLAARLRRLEPRSRQGLRQPRRLRHRRR